MEHFQKIIYLLSLFLPVMLFFAIGLWMAWLTWFKDCTQVQEAIQEYHDLVKDLNELYQDQYVIAEHWEILLQEHKLEPKPPAAAEIHKSEDYLSLSDEKDKLQLQIEKLNSKRKRSSAKILALKAQNKELKQLITNVEAEADSYSSAFSGIDIMSSILKDFADEAVRNDSELGIVFDEKPDHTDDLTQLDHLAVTDSYTLNELGIYRFKQIALWTTQQFMTFKQKLSIGNEVQDGDWQQQAEKLDQDEEATSSPLSEL